MPFTGVAGRARAGGLPCSRFMYSTSASRLVSRRVAAWWEGLMAVFLSVSPGCGRIGYEALQSDTRTSNAGSSGDAAVVDASVGETPTLGSSAGTHPRTSDSSSSEATSSANASDELDAGIRDASISDTGEQSSSSVDTTLDAGGSSPTTGRGSTSPGPVSSNSEGGGESSSFEGTTLPPTTSDAPTTSDIPASSGSDTPRSSSSSSAPPPSSETSATSSESSSSETCANTALDCGGSCAPCPCTWGTPEILGDPNHADNDLYSPSLSADGLTLWFGVLVQGGPEQVGYSTRATPTDPFGIGALVGAPVSSNGWDGNPQLSFDQRSLYFYSMRSNTSIDLFRATRPTASDNFDQVAELTTLNSAGTEQLPWISVDECTIYFVSDRAGTRDIYVATRAQPSDAFSAPQPVTELNSGSDDAKLTLSADGLVAIFASDRSGGTGALDLYRAARATTAEAFEAPTLIGELSTAQGDYDPEFTRDGNWLYFASDRSGSSAIWRTTVTCP